MWVYVGGVRVGLGGRVRGVLSRSRRFSLRGDSRLERLLSHSAAAALLLPAALLDPALSICLAPLIIVPVRKIKPEELLLLNRNVCIDRLCT